ncbi:Rap1a/Tai family immunity protein [Pseudomonas sp. P5_C3]
MKAWIGVAAALVGAIGSGVAMADGNQLLSGCQSVVKFYETNGKEGDAFGAGTCIGVIQGVTSLRGITNPALSKQAQTCMPTPSPPNIQAARIAVKYLQENPEKLNMDEGILMLFALQRAFPCKG